MTTRREFLQAGMAVSALPLGATIRAAASPASTRAEGTSFHRVVFDERFADSVAFAAGMRARGGTLHAIRGDITDFWYRELYAVWQREPAAVAGLTAHGPMFCLEQLARGHRLRVVFRAEHRYRADGCVEHLIAAPDALLGTTSGLAGAGPAWGAHIAAMVSRGAWGRASSTAAIVTPAAHRLSEAEDALYSWVIAPAAAAGV